MASKSIEASAIEISQSIGLLVRRVRAAAASHELSLTESAVLHRLETAPATTADLARAESVKPQSMGATVAALEERALVERKAHPTDGRQFHIHITAKGRALRASVRQSKRTWLAQAITKLDERDRDTLFKSAEIMRRLAEK